MLADGPMPYADVGAALEQSTVTWRDLRWIRELWNGPIVVKGVHIGDDARRAVDDGRERGRRLQSRRPAARRRSRRRSACCRKSSRRSASEIEVLLDGGIRRGSDIVKALCLGARAVLIGRAYAYGLGAAGGAGVARAIEILRADLIRTIKLLGCPSTSALESIVHRRAIRLARRSPGAHAALSRQDAVRSRSGFRLNYGSERNDTEG